MNAKLSIRELRISKGLSQMDLSEKSGVHSVSLSRYENRKATPSARNLQKIAAALEVSASDIQLDVAAVG